MHTDSQSLFSQRWYILLLTLTSLIILTFTSCESTPSAISDRDSSSESHENTSSEPRTETSSLDTVESSFESSHSIESSGTTPGIDILSNSSSPFSSNPHSSSQVSSSNEGISVEARSSNASPLSSSDAISSSSALESSSSIIPPYENHDDNSAYLFDESIVRTYNILIHPDSLAYLDRDPWVEDYVEGDLVLDGDTIQKVGIRYKGSFGAFTHCTTNKPGSKTCTKLSLKIKFSWDDASKGRRFYGQKKLNLHSMNNYQSYLREKVGYWIFQEMGVPSPRTQFVRVLINNKLSGLYLLTENIDSRFAKNSPHYFANDEGNIYKETPPLMINGEPFPDYVHIAGLRSNTSTPDVSGMLKFANALSTAQGAGVTTALSEWTDVSQMVKFFMVSRAINNGDGPFYWSVHRYTQPSWWYEVTVPSPPHTNHNYFFYEDPVLQKFHMVAWDLDYSLYDITDDTRTPQLGAPALYPCNMSEQTLDMMCDKFTAGIMLFENEYRTAVADYLDRVHPQIHGKIDTWAALIRQTVIEASSHHGDAPTLGAWEGDISVLKGEINNSYSVMALYR
ncbi:MAG: CotH kinase family protein [Fibrobacterales bacterium]